MKRTYDVIVIGGGPSGSSTASFLKVQNPSLDVALVEQLEFPRFRIGESLLPASIPHFKAMKFFDKLKSGKYIVKYGARFYSHQSSEDIYFNFSDCGVEDLAFAFEVPRKEFDHDLLRHAESLGTEVFQPESVLEVVENDEGVRVRTDRRELQGRFLVDSSGRSAHVATRRNQKVSRSDFNNAGVFGHFKGIKRYSGKHEGDITITVLNDGAWSWIIPFLGDMASVGVVFSSKNFPNKRPDWDFFQEQLNLCKEFQQAMVHSELVGELRTVANYSQFSEQLFGKNWILVGDASTFIDPIFSSGVHLGISAARKASELILQALTPGHQDGLLPLGQSYVDHMALGIKRFRGIISMFYQREFVAQMRKTLNRPHLYQAFTGVVAGDVWNEENPLFQHGVI